MAIDRQGICDNLDLWTSALLTKSTAGRGNNGKLEAYGIKKLRELILEQAVRGKLLPQNPYDELVGILFDQIEKEKAQLVIDGKIRKEGVLPKISEEDTPYKIPASWKWARLSDLYYSISPSRSKIKTSEFLAEGKYPVIDQGKSYIAGYTNESELLIEIPGPIIIFGDHTTEIKYIDFDFVAGADGTKILRPYRMDEKYFCMYLKSYKLENRGYARHFKVLNDNFMAVPPLAEQHRIVAKVDELMALCDQLEKQQANSIEAHQALVEILLGTLTRVDSQQELTEAWTRIADHFDTLFTTEQSIDQLKQTILQLAVMGKLVHQDPRDEPASKLLKRKEAKNDGNYPFKVPDSWVWARVDEFAQTRLGKMLDKAKNKGRLVRYLRNINVRWFDFDLSDVKEMRFEDSELEEFALRRGDVLICEGGYPGRAAVWDEREANIYFQKAIHRVRFQNEVNPYYFVNVLRESADSGRLSSYFTGAGIQHFTGKGLMAFLVPLPPPNEQHRIVAKVDELMALCDALKARLADARTTQIHLADAIVEQAVA
jgi:type I restriction enzyme S subunit